MKINKGFHFFDDQSDKKFALFNERLTTKTGIKEGALALTKGKEHSLSL